MFSTRELEQKFNIYKLVNHELILSAEFSQEATAKLI